MGCKNLKYTLMPRPKIVHHRMERPVWYLENKAQIGGLYNEQPVTAPTLNTISTIPPADGTMRATKMVRIPNTITAPFATNINCFGLVLGRTDLYKSLVKTAAARLSVVFTELAVANTIPPSIRPISPLGSTSLHIIKYAPSFSSLDSSGLTSLLTIGGSSQINGLMRQRPANSYSTLLADLGLSTELYRCT